jgi:tRNA 2-thiocytidine biosynthesis protein TtcA
MKEMIQGWDRKFPGRVDNMFTALANVVPSHLMDRQLYPFETVKATGAPVQGGDIAFDEDEGCGSPSDGAPGSLGAGTQAISLTSLKLTPKAAPNPFELPDEPEGSGNSQPAA